MRDMGPSTSGRCSVRAAATRALWGTLLIALSACGEGNSPLHDALTTASTNDGAKPAYAGDAGSIASDASVDPMRGIWLGSSWGLALEAGDGVLVMHEITELSCRPYLEVPYEGLTIPSLGMSGKIEAGNLVLRSGLTDEIVSRLAERSQNAQSFQCTSEAGSGYPAYVGSS